MFSIFKKYPSITTKDLKEKLKENITLLDVRSPSEYRAGHITKAQNVPLNKIDGFKPKQETTIYVICQSGMRSKQAAKILSKKGYDVINIQGGMSQWSGSIRGGK